MYTSSAATPVLTVGLRRCISHNNLTDSHTNIRAFADHALCVALERRCKRDTVTLQTKYNRTFRKDMKN